MVEWIDLLIEASKRVQSVANYHIKSGKKENAIGMGAAGDLTLEIDSEAEEVIIEMLRDKDVRVISEEIGVIGKHDARWVAIIDPIDGSSNFQRGIPFYCTSIAIADGKSLSEVKYGVVRDLVNGDTYYAIKGEGARKNGKEIRGSMNEDIDEAIIAVDLCSAKRDAIERILPLISSVKRQVHLGANALELCYVADGSIDSFIDARGRMRITDIAAAYLIVKEAGGMITSLKGYEIDPILALNERLSIIASGNRSIHERLIGLIRD